MDRSKGPGTQAIVRRRAKTRCQLTTWTRATEGRAKNPSRRPPGRFIGIAASPGAHFLHHCQPPRHAHLHRPRAPSAPPHRARSSRDTLLPQLRASRNANPHRNRRSVQAVIDEPPAGARSARAMTGRRRHSGTTRLAASPSRQAPPLTDRAARSSLYPDAMTGPDHPVRCQLTTFWRTVDTPTASNRVGAQTPSPRRPLRQHGRNLR